MLKLVDLEPQFLFHGGEGVTNAQGQPVPERPGVGLSFACPCGTCGIRCVVLFTNPLDGGPPVVAEPHPTWVRTGETFETLTLTPSILRTPPMGCGWHGFVTNGEVLTC